MGSLTEKGSQGTETHGHSGGVTSSPGFLWAFQKRLPPAMFCLVQLTVSGDTVLPLRGYGNAVRVLPLRGGRHTNRNMKRIHFLNSEADHAIKNNNACGLLSYNKLDFRFHIRELSYLSFKSSKAQRGSCC